MPKVAAEAVLVKSESLAGEADHPPVGGVDWNRHVDLDAIMSAMATTGFQATELGRAIDEINRMRSWRLRTNFCRSSWVSSHLQLRIQCGCKGAVTISHSLSLTCSLASPSLTRTASQRTQIARM